MTTGIGEKKNTEMLHINFELPHADTFLSLTLMRFITITTFSTIRNLINVWETESTPRCTERQHIGTQTHLTCLKM